MEGLDRLSQMALAAARNEDCWLQRIRAGLTAALAFLDEQPQWARLLVLESPLEGPAVRECTRLLAHALADVLEQARSEVIVGCRLMPPPELICELMLGGLLSLVRARMLRRGRGALASLAPSLMGDVVEPYLARGAAKADRAAGRVPVEGDHGHGGVRAPAQVLPLRATPTHMAALCVIAARPHSSSREIDAATGPSLNDGNVAHLLGRLARRGLIENVAPYRATGQRSAWLITPHGQRVLDLNRHALPPAAPAASSAASLERRADVLPELV